ncbi:hypothetical protein ACFLV2_00780 [Chloroflexota bacterium]
MSMEWFRDLVICIFGIGATVVLVFIGILALMLYRKISPILDSSKAAVKAVQDISACVEEEVARPLAQVAAFVQGITQAVGLFSRFSKKNKG